MEEKILDTLLVKDGKFDKEFHSERYCPICLIEKPYKTRHVKKANLCVKEFQFYSKIFDKLIFYKNTKVYFLICLLHVFFLLFEIFGLIGSIKDLFTFYPVFYVIEIFLIEIPLHIKAIIIFNIFVFLSWVIDSILLLTSIYYGLTVDELMNPQYYPYLFEKTEKGYKYVNASNKGFVNNLREILTR